jgi:nitrogen-specific signal transduction histidine kinase
VARVESRGCDLVAKCDAREIKKAITYLLWYLVRNSAAEEVALSISVGPARARAGRLELVVAAPAAVREADDLERMFDPLAAVQGGVVDVGPAVSRRIIEAHGGRLEASTRGRDLVFRAELPLAAGTRSGRPEDAR